MRSTAKKILWGAQAAAIAAALVVGGAVQTASADDLNPSLDTQNAAHDHVLGSSLEAPTAAARAAAAPSAGAPSAAAPSAAAPSAAPASSVLGFDVSGFQPNVNWAATYAAGARFVYIKATEGYNSTNSLFRSQWQGATSAGFIRGAYHFADPYESQSGAREASWFLANGGKWAPDGKTLPPVLDVEKNPYRTYGNVTVDACYNMSPGQLASWIADFSNTMLSGTGIRPTIYTNPDFWQTCMQGNTAFGANPLFVANWSYNPATGPGTLPASWSSYAFWQFGDDGGTPRFPGDQDLFNGTLADLTTFADHATPDSRYIKALYEDYLNRAPAPTESAGWQDHLAAGTPRSAIADGFVGSDEYRLQRIDAAYKTILGRASDGPGRLTWLNNMKAGRITTDDIETSLYASLEYYRNHGNTDTGFVASLYRTLLHRSGTAAEYGPWVALVASNGRPYVVAQFWDSPETISQRVSAMYQLYLGRVPDASGLQYWVSVALQIGDSGLRSGFTSSNEYYTRSQSRTI